MNAPFEYEPDEHPKRKHRWGRDEAGFAMVRGRKVGKCPRGFSLETAQSLVNSGMPWSPQSWRHQHPKRIYVVHDGVVYRAVETVPGRSYHGFPEAPEGFPRGARMLKEQLLRRAVEQGQEHDVKRWMNW
ncbi:MAG: hypothetical protein WD250_11400 [Egibacteraceae bacterium]